MVNNTSNNFRLSTTLTYIQVLQNKKSVHMLLYTTVTLRA